MNNDGKIIVLRPNIRGSSAQAPPTKAVAAQSGSRLIRSPLSDRILGKLSNSLLAPFE
jgi:hypothetical protein